MAATNQESEPLTRGMDNSQHDPPPSYEGHRLAPTAPSSHAPSYFTPSAPYSQPHHYSANPPGVITAQPRLMTSLTGASRSTLQSMHQRNPEARNQLDGLLGNLATNMEIRAAQDISRMAANWTFDGLVSSMLLPEEEVSDDQQLLHVGAWVKEENGAIQQKLPKGRVIVTNKRLLFVSCGTNQESSLVPGRETGAYSYFALSTAATDAVSFSPLPLKSIKSVMFSAEATSKWTAQIKGLLSCLAMCTQNGQVSNWTHGQPYQAIEQHRIIRIGVVLPPFEKTVVIDVYLDPSLALRTATDFAAKLQRHIPDSTE